MRKKSLPVVPKTHVFDVGNWEGISEIREEFFGQVLSFLGYDDINKTKCFVNIECKILVAYRNESPLPTDEEIALLKVEEYVVASVLYYRNLWNNVVATYSSYLDEEIINRIKSCDRD